jgi:hypothetical protein
MGIHEKNKILNKKKCCVRYNRKLNYACLDFENGGNWQYPRPLTRYSLFHYSIVLNSVRIRYPDPAFRIQLTKRNTITIIYCSLKVTVIE